MTPSGALGDSATRVLLAVVDQRRPTVRSVAAAVAMSSSAVHQQLVHLRAEGLVAWEDGKDGTLRAMVEEV